MAEQTHNGGFLFNFPIYSHLCHHAAGVSTAKPIPFSFPSDPLGKARSPGLSPTAWSQPKWMHKRKHYTAIMQNYCSSSLLATCTSTSHKPCVEGKGLTSLLMGLQKAVSFPKHPHLPVSIKQPRASHSSPCTNQPSVLTVGGLFSHQIKARQNQLKQKG